MKKWLKRSLSSLLVFAMVFTTCFFAGMGITAFKSKAAYSGTLKVDENGNFTILQIADVQGCYPLPDQWINTIRLAVSTAEPDLIVMTGDNVVSNEQSEGIWNTLDQIVDEFYYVDSNGDKVLIPFTFTFGNHDTESNGHNWISQDYYKYCLNGTYDNGDKNRTVAKGKKGYYADNQDFSGYTNFVDYDKSSQISGLTTMGTGYIDIYSNDGSTVVERVILLNSGTYDDNGGYGKPGYNTKAGYNGATQYNNDAAYNGIVAAVNSWTSDPNIKCIGFQRIPFREFYKGDSASTSILTRSATQTNASYLKAYGAIGDSNITSGWYAPNTSNSTVKGVYSETCCASYGDTSALYNAYAKDNVYGVFFGHDHGNTLSGVATVDGKTLRMGYGGGINTEWNGAGVSAFSYYTLNANYSGPADTKNFKKTDNDYSSYINLIGASYGPKTYAPNTVNYIKQLGLEYAPHSIWQVRTFEKALENLGNSYIPLLHMYNDAGSDADFNKGTGKSTDDVCIGYKTSTNPSDAITGIIGYRTESGNHPKQIQVALQDGYNVTYYLDDNDVDCSGGISDYYTLVYYTRDPKAGPPITDLYMTYESSDNSWSWYNTKQGETIGDYKVCSWLSDDLSHLEEWRGFDFNTGCGSGTPYIYLEYASHGTEDVTRAYYDILNAYNDYGKVYDSNNERYTETSYRAYDAKRREVEAFIATLQNPYSPETSAEIYDSRKVLIEAYNNLVPKTDGAGRQVKSNDDITPHYHLAVPETIYLAPDASAATTGQHYINNKLDSNNKLVCDGTYSTTGKFELSCPNCVNVSVNVVRMTGTTFNINGTTGYNTDGKLVVKGDITTGTHSGGNTDIVYSYAAAVTPDSNGKIAGTISYSYLGSGNGIAPGGTSLLEWRFTITRANYTEETVYAYTVVYAPYTSPVGAAVDSYVKWDTNHAEVQHVDWWEGVHSFNPTRPSSDGNSNDEQGAYYANRKANNANKYVSPLLDGIKDDGSTADGDDISGYLSANAVTGHEKSIYYGYTKWTSVSNNWRNACVRGFTALLTVDSSRYTNLNTVPNVKAGTIISEASVNNNNDGDVMRISLVEGSFDGYWSDGSSGDAHNVIYNHVNGGFKPLASGSASGSSQPFHGTIDYSWNSKESGTKNFCYACFTSRTCKRGINYIANCSGTAYAPIQLTLSDKSAMREDIGYYESLSPQRDWYSTDNEFTPFMNALVAACLNLGNPASANNSTTELGTKYNSFLNNQDRGGSITVDGVTYTYPKYYTVEQNFGLKCTYDGYAHTGYVVEPILVDRFEFYGTASNGLRAMDTVFVKPYNLEEDNYYYQGFMDGEGFDPLYGRDPSALTPEDKGVIPMLGDTFKFGYMGNLYDDFNVVSQVNYGHITAEEMYRGLNEFYFYYHKGNDFRMLTFDMNGGTFSYGGTNYTGTQYQVRGYEDDEFQIRLLPTRSGYIFDGWELTTGDGSGTYNDVNTTYTYGSTNGTLRAKWLRITDLVMNSDGGITANNLIYFYEGRDYADFSNANLTAYATYEDDSDVTITGNITATGSEIAPQLDNKLVVYLVAGHTYQISYDCTNKNMDFFLYTKGSFSGRSGRLKNYSSTANEDGTYTSVTTFTVGGTQIPDGDGRNWQNGFTDAQLTTEYNFRISVNGSQPSGEYTFKNLRIVEVDTCTPTNMSLQKVDDNRITQLEGTTRIIQNPPTRCDEWIFGGYEVYVDSNDDNSFADSEYVGSTENPDTVRDYIYFNTSGCYTFKYSQHDVKLKTIWIKPLGLALDNMFNYYEFRYNEASAKLSGSGKTNGDTLNFNNTNQTINVKDDGTPNGTSSDVYTAYGASDQFYRMPVRKYVDEDGNEKTAAYYLLTMDITVNSGAGQWFVFNYDSNGKTITSDTYKATGASFSSGSGTLASEYPGSSKHVSKIIQITSNTAYLQMRFGFSSQGGNVTFSNIRLVPMNAAAVADDTLGYAVGTQDPVTPVTHTYHITKSGTIAEYLNDYADPSPTRNGYAFLAWADAQGNIVNSGAKADVNYTLFSQWTGDEYILKYDENTDDEIENMPVNNAEDAPSPDVWSLIYDNSKKASVDGIVDNAVPTDKTNGNNLFMGWNTEPDGSGDTFYPGVVIERSTIDGWYSTAKAAAAASDTPDDKTMKLYAQWYDTTDAIYDASRNEEGEDLEQLKTNVVSGVSVDANGDYVETLYKMKDTTHKVEISKFDDTLHKTYTDAIDTLTDAINAYNTASTKPATAKTVDATTTKGIKDACDGVTDAAEELEGTDALNEVDASYYNNFYVNDVRHSLADMNLNHYQDKTLSDASNAKKDGKDYAYSSGTTLNKAFDIVGTGTKAGLAQAKLNSAVETMAKSFVNEKNVSTKANFQVYENADVINQLLGNSDVSAVNYVYEGKGYYTYYCYVNTPNPQVVIDIDDTSATDTTNGTKTRYCYPTSICDASGVKVSGNGSGYSSQMVTLTDTAVTDRYSAYLSNGLGTSESIVGTANKNTPANYYNQKQRITLTPSFNATKPMDDDRKVISYKFYATDDSYNAQLADTATLKGYANYSGSKVTKDAKTTTLDAAEDTSVTAENQITFAFEYHPIEAGLEVYTDQVNIDSWLGQYHIFRTSGGASNWEMIKSQDTVYTINDPIYGQTDYASFAYTFDNTFITKVNNYNTSNGTGVTFDGSVFDSNDSQAQKASRQALHNYIKANWSEVSGDSFKGTNDKNNPKGTGFIVIGQNGWSTNYYPKSKAYTYVHVIDRWGNVADEVFHIPNIDPKAVKTSSAKAGFVIAEETGGSGINTMSLNSNNVQIITDENSTLEGNVYKTTGNTVKINTGAADKSYTLTTLDVAGNKSTLSVKSDADGFIVITVTDDAYTFDGEAYTFMLNDYEINLYDGIEKHIKSVTNPETTVKEQTNVEIVTCDEVTMVQLVDNNGNTKTTLSYTETSDGKRTWSIPKTLSAAGEYTYTVRAKVNGKWYSEDRTATITVKENVPVTFDNGVTEVSYVKSLNTENTFTVKVIGSPTWIQFTSDLGTTRTYGRTNEKVQSIETTEDGEIWTIATSLSERDYTARAKYDTKWQTRDAYAFTVELLKKPEADDAVYSCEIKDAYDGCNVFAGKNVITIVTGTAVTKVQLLNNVSGSTSTFTASNAQITELDGKKIWTIEKNFNSYGSYSYTVMTRTSSTKFTDSGLVLEGTVLY